MFAIYFRDGLLLQAFGRYNKSQTPRVFRTTCPIEAAKFSKRAAVERLRELRSVGCSCWLVPA